MFASIEDMNFRWQIFNFLGPNIQWNLYITDKLVQERLSIITPRACARDNFVCLSL